MKTYLGSIGLALALFGAACSPEASQPPPDADSGTVLDAGGRDAGAGYPDAGLHDSGTPDAGAALDGGADSGSASDAGTDAGLAWGTPIVAPADAWTWVPFPDSACNDGTPVGIGINPSATSSNVLIYFNGGGACWDYFTCYIAGSATLGPYGPTKLTSDVASTGSVLTRTDMQNPFRDWNYVYVPYCTGDVHSGDNVVTYTLGTTSNVFHHKGHANVMAYLARLGPTFPSPGKVMVVGDSAGGAGAVVNYASVRAYWPNAESYLIDDSLAFFTPAQTPAATMSSEIANWGITPLLRDICGAACATDFSLIYPGLRTRFPSDRMALLSYEQDATMSAYYETVGFFYQLYLNQLASQGLQPAHMNTFFMTGTAHTLLWSWATVSTTQSVNLRDWINEMVADSPQWTAAGP